MFFYGTESGSEWQVIIALLKNRKPGMNALRYFYVIFVVFVMF